MTHNELDEEFSKACNKPEENPVHQALKVLEEHGVNEKTRKEIHAMMSMVGILTSLEPQQNRRIVRWVCEVMQIPLDEFDDSDPVSPKSIPFSEAREVMRACLRHHMSLLDNFVSSVSKLLYDELYEINDDVPLLPEQRDEIAGKIIHLIFSSDS